MRVPEAIFGIHSSALNAAVELLILFLIVIWAALIYWTYADARRRIADPMLVGCATAAAFFPYVGTIVYMIVRPPEFLEDVRERELEIQAAEARLAELGYQLCPHCDGQVEKDFLRCPHCMRKLRDPCAACGRPLDPRWRLCPFCETEVGAASGARRVAGRRSEQLVGSGGPLAGTPAQAQRPTRRTPRVPGEPASPQAPAPTRAPGPEPSRTPALDPDRSSPRAPERPAQEPSRTGAPRAPERAPTPSPRRPPAEPGASRPPDAGSGMRPRRLVDPTA
jgi:hypothetical protein